MHSKHLFLAVYGLAATVAVVPALDPPSLPGQTASANARAAAKINPATHRQRPVNIVSWLASPTRPEPQPAAAPAPTDSTVQQAPGEPADQGPSTPPGPASPRPTPTPTPAPPRAPTPPRAPAPMPAHPATTTGIVPPDDPSASIAPSPNFLTSCSFLQYDDSSACVNASLQAIANARAAEGLGPMVLPANWGSLTAQEQLFVATNLERTVRGLEPISAMVAPLDATAQAAASADSDPSVPAVFGFVKWGGNLAGGLGNPLEVIYFWMYDDGPDSVNTNCTATDAAGCWGHRNNILMPISGSNLEIGVGYSPTAFEGAPVWTELLVEGTQPSAIDFSGQ